MAIADSLKPVQFVTDDAGHRAGVLLDIRTWEALMAWVEDATDRQLAAKALQGLTAAGGRPGEAGWAAWEQTREGWLEEEEGD